LARIVYTDLSGNEQTVPFGPEHPVVTVGRATDCTIRSNRKSVSRRHAEFRYSNGQFEVIDLNSSNGTYLIINEERKPIIGREYLADNDEVWCGDFIIRFFEEGGMHGGVSAAPAQDSSPPPPPPKQGGGWANRASSGPVQQPSRDNAAFITGPPEGGVGFGLNPGGAPSDGVDFGAQQQPVGFGNAPSSGTASSLAEESSSVLGDDDPPTRQAGVDVSRLLDEKKSIEDLAARQAAEIEDLQQRLEDLLQSSNDTSSVANPDEVARLRDELEESRSEQSRLEARLHDALQMAASTADLNSEIDELRRKNEQLDAEWRAANQRVDELTDRLDSSASDRTELESLREDNRAKGRDIEALEGEIERLHESLDTLRAEAENARNDDAREELESLRMELERHGRLVDEFERRNRDLQKKVAELEEGASTASDLSARVGQLESELAEARALAKALENERDEALETAERERESNSASDLKDEIEGLKRRLKMEKERAAAAEEEASQKIAELEAVAQSGSDGGGLAPGQLKEAAELVDKMVRLVDAIERAELDALSTVDRVRLQSALRDTEPRSTLSRLQELLDGE
jgi:chromosome segregation ATPase